MLCYITCVMVCYITCVMFCYITYVMLCTYVISHMSYNNICYVI